MTERLALPQQLAKDVLHDFLRRGSVSEHAQRTGVDTTGVTAHEIARRCLIAVERGGEERRVRAQGRLSTRRAVLGGVLTTSTHSGVP